MKRTMANTDSRLIMCKGLNAKKGAVEKVFVLSGFCTNPQPNAHIFPLSYDIRVGLLFRVMGFHHDKLRKYTNLS